MLQLDPMLISTPPFWPRSFPINLSANKVPRITPFWKFQLYTKKTNPKKKKKIFQRKGLRDWRRLPVPRACRSWFRHYLRRCLHRRKLLWWRGKLLRIEDNPSRRIRKISHDLSHISPLFVYITFLRFLRQHRKLLPIQNILNFNQSFFF